MARLRIDKPVRATLLDELQARGIAPLTPERTTILETDPGQGGGWLTVPNNQEATARAAIDAHDAAALDAGVEQDRTRAAQDAALVKAYMGVAAPTAAQTAAALKAFIRVVRRTMADLKD
jgi:hypothetical protein